MTPLLTKTKATEVDIAWAAGVFEGEGCIAVAKGACYSHMQLVVVMSDEDIITRLHDVLGLGVVRGPFFRKTAAGNDAKPLWMWRAGAFQHTQAILGLFWKHLGKRRKERAATALRLCGVPRKYKSHCPQGHEYTSENTRVYGAHRSCKECGRIYARAYVRKKAAGGSKK